MSSLLNRAKSLKSNKDAAPKAKHYDSGKGRPSDDLLARYTQFNNINRTLIDWFTATRDSQLNSAKELNKQASSIHVPFAEGDQFIQDGHGFQNMLYGLRDSTRQMSELHSSFAHQIDNEVLSLLQENKVQLKTHLDGMNSDLGKTADVVDKEREHSTNALGEHSKAVSMAGSENGLGANNAKHDPFITHGTVERQLLRQLEHENKLTRGTIDWQKRSERFEKDVVNKMHRASELFTQAQQDFDERLQKHWSTVGSNLVSVDATKEWEHYSNPESGRILDPQTQMRDPEYLQFPDQNHAYSKPLKEGLLERKKRHTKNYSEHYMILTPAGFLHEYPALGISGDDPKAFQSNLSLYLPDYTLSPPAGAGDKKHKLSLVGQRKSASGKDASHGFRRNKEVAYTFKARSHSELMSWWEALDGLTKRSLTASQSQSSASRTPANQTVASVGLPRDSSRQSSVAYDEPEPRLSRSYVPSTTSTARQQAEEEEEVSDDDEHSIGGSSVEEDEANTSTGSALGSTVVHVENQTPISVSTHPNHTHQTLEAAEPVDLPTYHGNSTGYPIDKKVDLPRDASSPAPIGDSESSAAPHLGEHTTASTDREEAAPISTSNGQVS